MIDVRRGHRASSPLRGCTRRGRSPASGVSLACGTEVAPAAAVPEATGSIVDLHVRHLGADFARFSAEADLTNGAELRVLLVAAVRRRGGDPAQIDEYEMDIRRPSHTAAIMTFATLPR